MFTGIISHLGKLKDINQSCYTFSTDRSFFAQLETGSSVSVNGICLTVTTISTPNTFSVDVMPETVKKTMIKTLKIGDYVNLELPISPQSLFAGHIVPGHVDGVGVITTITPQGNSHVFTIGVTPKLSRYMAAKGSVAVNGISLAIIDAGSDFFTVGIIPFTRSNTMLQYSGVGDLVNIEVDVIAKYVEKLLEAGKHL